VQRHHRVGHRVQRLQRVIAAVEAQQVDLRSCRGHVEQRLDLIGGPDEEHVGALGARCGRRAEDHA